MNESNKYWFFNLSNRSVATHKPVSGARQVYLNIWWPKELVASICNTCDGPGAWAGGMWYHIAVHASWDISDHTWYILNSSFKLPTANVPLRCSIFWDSAIRLPDSLGAWKQPNLNWKGIQKRRKRSEKAAQSDQHGIKRVPKWGKGPPKTPLGEQGRTSEEKMSSGPLFFGIIFGTRSIKIPSKNK